MTEICRQDSSNPGFKRWKGSDFLSELNLATRIVEAELHLVSRGHVLKVVKILVAFPAVHTVETKQQPCTREFFCGKEKRDVFP